MGVKQMYAAVEVHEIVEVLLKAMAAQEYPLSSIFAGIHNAFCHGEIMDDAGLAFEDDDIGFILDRLTEIQDRLRKLEDGE